MTATADRPRRTLVPRPRRTPRPADGAMTLAEHLYELRDRLVKAAVAITIGAVVGYIFFPQIFEFIKHPYCTLPASRRPQLSGGSGCVLAAFGPLDQFMIRFKVGLSAGLLLSSPVWLYQLWAFITPGLHKHERRYAVGFVAASVSLFAAGGALSYLTMQKGLQLLLGIAPGVISVLEVQKYLGYFLAMILVFGVAFEFPLLVVMLNRVNVASHARLAGWRRPMIFGVFVFAAVATPSQDPFTMLALAVPMTLLYEVALLVTRVHDRRKARRELAEARALGVAGLSPDEASPLDERPSDLGDLP